MCRGQEIQQQPDIRRVIPLRLTLHSAERARPDEIQKVRIDHPVRPKKHRITRPETDPATASGRSRTPRTPSGGSVSHRPGSGTRTTWARASRWVYEHPEEWIVGYYVKDQGLSPADGRYLAELAGEPDIPADWSDAIARHQETIDILVKETGNPVLKAQDLYDLRYQTVGADAVKGGA